MNKYGYYEESFTTESGNVGSIRYRRHKYPYISSILEKKISKNDKYIITKNDLYYKNIYFDFEKNMRKMTKKEIEKYFKKNHRKDEITIHPDSEALN